MRVIYQAGREGQNLKYWISWSVVGPWRPNLSDGWPAADCHNNFRPFISPCDCSTTVLERERERARRAVIFLTLIIDPWISNRHYNSNLILYSFLNISLNPMANETSNARIALGNWSTLVSVQSRIGYSPNLNSLRCVFRWPRYWIPPDNLALNHPRWIGEE